MKPNGLLIAAGLLAVLGGAIWWSNKKQDAASKNPATAETKILTIPSDQIQEIVIKHAAGETDDLRNDGTWTLTSPKRLSADPDAASALATALSSVAADKTIEEKASDVSQYGLTKPALDVTVTRKDGKTDEILIGDDTPNGSGAYAKLPSSPKVYSVFSFVKTSLNKTVNDLRDKRLLPFDSDKLTRVDLTAKNSSEEFGKDAKGEWQILKPSTLRADGAQVDTLVNKLKDAKMDATISDDDAKKAAAGFAGGTKVATAAVTDQSGTRSIEVRKDKDKNYYAKSTAVEGIYKIGADVGDALDKSLDDFRNKKLFEFGFSDPTKLDIKNGAAAASYSKSGDKWMLGAKTMDNASVQNLIDKLRDLAASKFVTAGSGEVVFQATVTSDSGKRNETVVIRKQGTQYFAQRQGEPSIYELDAKAAEDVEKAASDVKEQAAAPPPAPKKK
jgi:ribosomal protein L12E/L44/L45/RPP1/RPP2